MAQAQMKAQAEEAFKTAREQYESQETKAYKQYQKDKERGMTNDDFYRWMPQNYPQAGAALQQLQSASGQLSAIWSQSGESQERLQALSFASNPNTVVPGKQTIRKYDEDRADGSRPSLRDFEKKKLDDALNL